MIFPELTEPTFDEIRSGVVREFIGDGSPLLPVHGLIGHPHSVRVGTTEVPLRIPITFQNNRLNGQTIDTDMPLLAVAKDAAGNAVLRRSLSSNDGNWQKGAKVFVWGEWQEEAKAEEAKPETAGKSR